MSVQISRRGAIFVLTLLFGVLALLPSGHASEGLELTSVLADLDPLRLPSKHWLRLSVDVKEYHPEVTYNGNTNTIHSLAILPTVLLQVPDRHVQPYLGAGLGLSLNDFAPDKTMSPLGLGVEESLVLHVGGGIAYRLSNDLVLIGSARYSQFKTAALLEHLSSSSYPLIRDGLDFNTYSVEFGIRLRY